MQNFADKIKEIKERAQQEIWKGAVVEPFYGAHRDTVLQILNEALATEIVCVLRYLSHFRMAKGINSSVVAAEFVEHAEEEQNHADKIAARIVQLGGIPNYNPEGLKERSHTLFSPGESLDDMLNDNLVAERIVIGIYQEFIKYLGDNDPTTRKLSEEILAQEEEHAENLASLLGVYARGGKRESEVSLSSLSKAM